MLDRSTKTIKLYDKDVILCERSAGEVDAMVSAIRREQNEDGTLDRNIYLVMICKELEQGLQLNIKSKDWRFWNWRKVAKHNRLFTASSLMNNVGIKRLTAIRKELANLENEEFSMNGKKKAERQSQEAR